MDIHFMAEHVAHRLFGLVNISAKTTDFNWTWFFATENRFNMGMIQYKLPLIVMVAA